jgi:hypothetical protein
MAGFVGICGYFWNTGEGRGDWAGMEHGENTFKGRNSGNVIQTHSVGGNLHVGDIHQHAAASPDHAADGVRALACRDYDAAVADLGAAVRGAQVDPELHFLLALALLRGNRPHRVRSSKDVTALRTHLERVGDLPHARLLLLMADEDRARGWERGADVPDRVRKLADTADPARVREILDHVHAPENRVWRVLAANQGRVS